MTHEIPAAERIRKARTALLLDHPFFGSLLFRLKGEECRSIPTMATNGVFLRYNPAFVDTLNAATLAGVLAHEVMHPALQHHTRRSKRDPVRWNEACDYAINPLLLDAGLSLPDDVLVDPRFRGMSAEQIYNQREVEAQPESSSESESAQGKNDNRHTASAAEMIVAFARENQLATIVGEKTAGRLLSATSVKVGNGFRLAMPTGAYYTWNGLVLEGTPMEPDELIEFNWHERRTGIDGQLEYANESIRIERAERAS